MELAEIGTKITEAIALQGKITNLNKQLADNENTAKNEAKEIARLESLIRSRDDRLVAIDALRKTVAALTLDLEARVAVLDKEGVSLPVGAKAQPQVVRM
jgi:predicted  nucleic acid-binding Zn-ribbon protein